LKGSPQFGLMGKQQKGFEFAQLRITGYLGLKRKGKARKGRI
jgi:hypothetical protein